MKCKYWFFVITDLLDLVMFAISGCKIILDRCWVCVGINMVTIVSFSSALESHIKGTVLDFIFEWACYNSNRRWNHRLRRWRSVPCCRCVITEPPDHIWGMKLPNGTWAGMTGMLHRKVGYNCTSPDDVFRFFSPWWTLACTCGILAWAETKDTTRSVSFKNFVLGLFDCPGGRLCVGRPVRDGWPCHCLWLHHGILLRRHHPANYPPWPRPCGPDLLLQAFPLAGLRAAGVWLSGDDSRLGVDRDLVREGV